MNRPSFLLNQKTYAAHFGVIIFYGRNLPISWLL